MASKCARGSSAFGKAVSIAGIVILLTAFWVPAVLAGEPQSTNGGSNTAPVAVDDAITIDEDTVVTIPVTDNDTDANSDPLTVTNVTPGLHGTTRNDGNGSITYTPGPNFNGQDQVTYTISDGHGGTDTGLVTITVLPINDAPLPADDAASTPKGKAVDIDVLSNDAETDYGVLTLAGVTQPAHGSAALPGSGLVRYTPAADFIGQDEFTYTIQDPQGLQGAAKVIVTVTEGGAAPVVIATLQEGIGGFAGTSDTYIDLYNPAGAPWDTQFLRTKTTENTHTLIQFDLNSLPAGATVQQATLRLFALSRTGGRPVIQPDEITLGSKPFRNAPVTFRLYEMLRAWDETEANWGGPLPSESWGATGCQEAGVDFTAEYADEIVGYDPTSPDWVEFDVTDLVNHWLADPASNHGVVLKAYLQRFTMGYTFVSSENTLMPARRPQLVITFTQE